MATHGMIGTWLLIDLTRNGQLTHLDLLLRAAILTHPLFDPAADPAGKDGFALLVAYRLRHRHDAVLKAYFNRAGTTYSDAVDEVKGMVKLALLHRAAAVAECAKLDVADLDSNTLRALIYSPEMVHTVTYAIATRLGLAEAIWELRRAADTRGQDTANRPGNLLRPSWATPPLPPQA